MTQQLTHWKRLRNPDYFGAYAMPTDGSDIVLTIKSAGQEKVLGTDGKKTDCLVIHFQESVKPMILNATNAKAINKVSGTPYVEKWSGTKIQIYTTKLRAFGEDREALRIREFTPQQLILVESQITPEQIYDACANLEACESLEELKDAYLSFSKALQAHPEVLITKDEMKGKLQS